jgi:hypothetical protein
MNIIVKCTSAPSSEWTSIRIVNPIGAKNLRRTGHVTHDARKPYFLQETVRFRRQKVSGVDYGLLA